MLLPLYFELGIRRAEPLVLKHNHLHLRDRENPTLVIVPGANDPEDLRRCQPLVKTAGRVLPLSPLLALTIDVYITEHRSKISNVKKNPFVVVETTNGRSMALSTIYGIFVTLRQRFPEDFPPAFSIHIMRHTWNDRFKAQAKAKGLNEAEIKTVGNYIMGWTKTPGQSTNYNRRHTEMQSTKILTAMQQNLVRIVG